MRPVVAPPGVRPGRLGPPAVPRAGGLGHGHPDAGHGDQHDGGEHRHAGRPVAGGGRPGGGPVTQVLDNAQYQRDDGVKGLAQDLGIEVPFLPAYSPSLNLIERVWRFTKRNAIYGKIHPTFADSRAAVQVVLDGVEATHADGLAPLMTLHFQEFEDVSLLAA